MYLHNLTSILADRGSLARPGDLRYSIPNQPETVHDLLLQKSNGTFELVVWGERLKGSDRVTVNLGSTHALVKLYDPTVGTSPIQTLTHVRAVPLSSSDHPVVIEIPAPAAGLGSRDGPSPEIPIVRVSEVTVHNDMDCFQVETPTATYVYGKRVRASRASSTRTDATGSPTGRAARPAASIGGYPSAASRPSSSTAGTAMASTRRRTPSPAASRRRRPATSASSPRRGTASRPARGTSTRTTPR